MQRGSEILSRAVLGPSSDGAHFTTATRSFAKGTPETVRLCVCVGGGGCEEGGGALWHETFAKSRSVLYRTSLTSAKQLVPVGELQ